jgi:hypothetical protein
VYIYLTYTIVQHRAARQRIIGTDIIMIESVAVRDWSTGSGRKDRDCAANDVRYTAPTQAGTVPVTVADNYAIPITHNKTTLILAGETGYSLD